jgi:hypothetical protein
LQGPRVRLFVALMLVYKVAEDARLPDEIRREFAFIGGTLIEVNGYLEELDCLYGSSRSTDTLSKTVNAFFARHKELLFDIIILALARLTGPSETGKGKRAQGNIALECLWKQLPDDCHLLRIELKQKCNEIQAKAKPLEIYRHKFLAHSSRDHHFSPSINMVPEFTVSTIRELIGQIEEYLFLLDNHFTKVGSVSYKVGPGYGSAEDLLHVLNNAVKNESMGCESTPVPI